MEELVELGYISAAHGIKGWVKLVSYCEPRTNIFDYKSWVLEPKRGPRHSIKVKTGQENGKTLIAALDACHTRNEAEALIGSKILVAAAALPELAEDEYYWRDLLGAAVKNVDGDALGSVSGFMETGANDVLVVQSDLDKSQHLIPFVLEHVVKQVSLEDNTIVVDWDPAF